MNVGYFCGIASCAENQAIGMMITNGEKYIKTIVAVHIGDFAIIPPCGVCREQMKQTSWKNLDAYVIISENKKVKLQTLLPHPWDRTIDSGSN